jgi:transcription termination factor Rho
VHTTVAHVLAVQVPVVQVVDVVAVHDRVVPAARAVGVAVHFRGNVLDGGHDAHAHMRRRA